MRDEHERVLESTNAGHYSSECSCGGSFGVFPSRKEAAAIHAVHAAGVDHKLVGTGALPEFVFTTAEWGEFELMPVQGFAHREFLEGVVTRWLVEHDRQVAV